MLSWESICYFLKRDYKQIFSSYTGGAAYPLWYAHYDNSASFSDFTAFGGWNTVNMLCSEYQHS